MKEKQRGGGKGWGGTTVGPVGQRLVCLILTPPCPARPGTHGHSMNARGCLLWLDCEQTSEIISSNEPILQMGRWAHGGEGPAKLKAGGGLGRNPFPGFFWPGHCDLRENVRGHSHPRRAGGALEGLAKHHRPTGPGPP